MLEVLLERSILGIHLSSQLAQFAGLEVAAHVLDLVAIELIIVLHYGFGIDCLSSFALHRCLQLRTSH